jgi:hypothetical protein
MLCYHVVIYLTYNVGEHEQFQFYSTLSDYIKHVFPVKLSFVNLYISHITCFTWCGNLPQVTQIDIQAAAR